MRKIILLLTLALMFTFSSYSSVLALTSGSNILDPGCSGNASDSAVCKDKDGTNRIWGTEGVLTDVANILAIIVGVAAVITIIISGIMYMTSQGDSSKVQAAKNAIIYAVIGLIVVAMARVIVGFVVNRV